MEVSVLEKPQTIKISSKRQITIPAKVYEQAGFDEYALATWTDKGLLLQPIAAEDEDATVDILRYLVSEGYEGEELISQYQELHRKMLSVDAALDEAEQDIAEGRTDSYENMRARIRDEYGI